MTKQEVAARLEKVEFDRFILAMKDRWDREDFNADARMAQEENELREMLKED